MKFVNDVFVYENIYCSEFERITGICKSIYAITPTNFKLVIFRALSPTNTLYTIEFRHIQYVDYIVFKGNQNYDGYFLAHNFTTNIFDIFGCAWDIKNSEENIYDLFRLLNQIEYKPELIKKNRFPKAIKQEYYNKHKSLIDKIFK